MKYQSLFIVLLFPIMLAAQSDEWGIGVVELPYDSKKSINVYNSPNGNIEGSLGMENSKYDAGYRVISWRDDAGPNMHIPQEALIAVGYEIDGLIVHKEQDGFLKIMYTEGDFLAWVSIAELRKAGFSYKSWKMFVVYSGRTFYTMNYGMNVRTTPKANGDLVLMVKGDEFEIEPTGKSDGLWAEVIIKEYNSEYCEEPHDLIKTYHGWMKILDDKGFPNIWFYAKGC